MNELVNFIGKDLFVEELASFTSFGLDFGLCIGAILFTCLFIFVSLLEPIFIDFIIRKSLDYKERKIIIEKQREEYEKKREFIKNENK